ncbi:MAG TPA: hypothetical protein VGB44_06325 [Flavobacterium sp.]
MSRLQLKGKLLHINLSLLCALLFAMLYQSVHSFHHIVEEFTVEKCHHNHSDSKTELTHQHDAEKCFTCEYRFSNFTPTTFYQYSVALPTQESVNLTLYFPQDVQGFSGSSTTLRGPPIVTA